MITSLQNNRIKRLVKLRSRRQRDIENVFLIEGYRSLKRALENNINIAELYFCQEMFLGKNEDALIEELRKRGAEIFPINNSAFKKCAYRDRPEGLLAVAPQFHTSLEQLPTKKNPFFIVAESIEKPGNLGTMLRTADGAGVDGLILCDKCTDIFNPNVVRASTGALFSVPIAEASSEDALSWLKKNNVSVLSATPHTDNIYTEVDLNRPLAVIVGTEQHGLSQRWLDTADIQVKIPMKGKMDSLNVSVATALLLYEVLRQRESIL
ncbi:MAG: RNA methyltransferase [Verrucomicrobiota bacterium]|nr:RNA methyltransferase [Verrucomicrobiota bacterium]